MLELVDGYKMCSKEDMNFVFLSKHRCLTVFLLFANTTTHRSDLNAGVLTFGTKNAAVEER